MKPRLSTRHETAMTLFEVGVVVAILVVLAALLLPMLAASKRNYSHINCTDNLKQVGIAYRIWEGDNGDTYPMAISVTSGGTRELVQKGEVVSAFQVMSNELCTPRILFCPGDGTNPGDTNRTYATDFGLLSNSNISYFIGVDVTNETNPRMILSGDCNFEIGGKPVTSGLLSLWTNDPVSWQPPRHGKDGNLAFADGSVQGATPADLRRFFQQTGLATNRLAIP